MRSLPTLLALLMALVLWIGCSDDECSVDQDCPADRICRANKCVDPRPGEGEGEGAQDTCRLDSDCDPPLVCDRVTQRCREREAQSDAGTPGQDSGSPDPGKDSGVDPDVPPDMVPPHVVSTDPPDSTRDVPVDKVIKVLFSEPIKEAIVEAAISLHDTLDPANDPIQGVGWSVVWDQATLTASITPPVGQTLKPYTTYKLVVREEIKDLENNFLVEFEDIFFTTASDAAAEAHYEAIARQHAPHIYQETNQQLAKADWLAAYDFNGGWRGNQKYLAWQNPNADLRGTLYWSVTETKTHYFIVYAYYHPFDYQQSGVENRQRENSMYGAQVVVAKSGAHRGWLAVETYVGGEFWAYTVEGDRVRARPENEGGIGQFKKVMPGSWLVDGTRYQAFIPYGTHESCIWGHRTNVMDMRCLQESEMSFHNNRGVHYVLSDGRVGEVPPANPSPCAGGCPAGESCSNGQCVGVPYGFRSLAAELWTRIHEYASLNEEIWSTPPFRYTPLPAASRRPGDGISLPRSFIGSVEGSLGQPPWAWEDKSDNELAQGQWFLDPAFVLLRHLKPIEGDLWSSEKQDYCWNVYLGIFRWKDPGCSGNE